MSRRRPRLALMMELGPLGLLSAVLMFAAVGLHNAWDVTLRMIEMTPN